MYIVPKEVKKQLRGLKEEREKYSLTLEQLAWHTGVRKEILAAWEEGKGSPTPAKYNRVAKFFGWKEWSQNDE